MPAHPLLNPSPVYVVRHVFASSKLPEPLQTVVEAHHELPYQMRCIDAWLYLTNDPPLAGSIQVWTGPNQTGERLCEFDCAKAVSGYLHEQEKMHVTGAVNPEGSSQALYLWRTKSVYDGEIYLMFMREDG